MKNSFSRSAFSRISSLVGTYICLMLLPTYTGESTLTTFLLLSYILNIGGVIVNLGKEWEIRTGKTTIFKSYNLIKHLFIIAVASACLTASLYAFSKLISNSTALYKVLWASDSGHQTALVILTGLVISGVAKIYIAICQRASKSGLNFVLEVLPVVYFALIAIGTQGRIFNFLSPPLFIVSAILFQLIFAFHFAQRYLKLSHTSIVPRAVIDSSSSSYPYAYLSTIAILASALTNLTPSIILPPSQYNIWTYAIKLSFCISFLPSVLYNQLPHKIFTAKGTSNELLNSVRKKSFLFTLITLTPALVFAIPALNLIFASSENIASPRNYALGILLVMLAEAVNSGAGPNDFILALKNKQSQVATTKLLSTIVYFLVILTNLHFFGLNFTLLAAAYLTCSITYNGISLLLCNKILRLNIS